jgi:hypothetical protein
LGIVTLFKEVQKRKTKSPIDDTPSGIVIAFKELQPSNTPLGKVVKFRGEIDFG